MNHEATIVCDEEGKPIITVTSAHGIAFTIRCCGSAKTDASVHIQDAGHLEPVALGAKIQRLLRQHARDHAGAHGARETMHRMRREGKLTATHEDTTIYTDATEDTAPSENDASAANDNRPEDPQGD